MSPAKAVNRICWCGLFVTFIFSGWIWTAILYAYMWAVWLVWFGWIQAYRPEELQAWIDAEAQSRKRSSTRN